MPQTDHITASRLADYRVQDHTNKYLGFVTEVVLEAAEGRISHVIVAADDSLLASKKKLMVPWSALVKAYNQQILTLDTSKGQLADYPEAPSDLLHRGLWAGAPEGEGASASFML